MYVETLEEGVDKYNDYCKQVEHFTQLRSQNGELSQHSQAFRQICFCLKELYRMMECLHNYCSLNRTAIDKILKKHDKNSKCESRATVMKAVSELRFFKEEGDMYLKDRIEVLWKQVLFSPFSHSSLWEMTLTTP